MDEQQPLLSICIPTFNRSGFLKVMLQALLPQTECFKDKVEVIISDNASTDNTQDIIKESKGLGTFKYRRKNSNEGVIANTIKCPLELATGKYIWFLSDHNLLEIDGLNRIISVLEKKEYNIYYVNFRCAKYPQHWPVEAHGGYNGNFEYLANNHIIDKKVDKWHELVQPHSALGTQLYAHIMKRKIWTEFWNGKDIPKHLQTASGTYPHTYMIAHTVLHAPGFYFGEPLFTIFNNAQTWNNLEQKVKVYLNGLPELIELYKQKGLPKKQVRKAQKWNKTQIKTILSHYLNSHDKDKRKVLLKGMIKNIFHPYLLSQIFNSFVVSRCCITSKFMYWIIQTKNRTIQYVFYNCRPARWVRNKKSLHFII